MTSDNEFEGSNGDGLDSSEALFSGYLYKQGGAQGGWKTWKRRYFELKEGALYYYKNDTKKVMLGVVPLQGVTLLDLSHAHAKISKAPEYIESKVCYECKCNFTLANRRKNCKGCGQSFCNQCSTKKVCIPSFGYYVPVRVCEGCHERVLLEYNRNAVSVRASPNNAWHEVHALVVPSNLPDSPDPWSPDATPRKYKVSIDLSANASVTSAAANARSSNKTPGSTPQKKTSSLNSIQSMAIGIQSILSPNSQQQPQQPMQILHPQHIPQTMTSSQSALSATSDDNMESDGTLDDLSASQTFDSEKDPFFLPPPASPPTQTAAAFFSPRAGQNPQPGLTTTGQVSTKTSRSQSPKTSPKTSPKLIPKSSPEIDPSQANITGTKSSSPSSSSNLSPSSTFVQSSSPSMNGASPPYDFGSHTSPSHQHMPINGSSSRKTPSRNAQFTLPDVYKPYLFAVKNSERELWMHAECLEDKDMWVTSIKTALMQMSPHYAAQNQIAPSTKHHLAYGRSQGVLSDTNAQLALRRKAAAVPGAALLYPVAEDDESVGSMGVSPIPSTPEKTPLEAELDEEEREKRRQKLLQEAGERILSYSSSMIDYSNLKLGNKVGTGAFGDVFMAQLWGTPVAVKTLKKLNPPLDTNPAHQPNPEDFANPDLEEVPISPEAIEDLKKEVEILSQLRHPNVVLYMGACFKLPLVCLVTEWCEKGSLYDVLHDFSVCLNAKRMIETAMGIAQGMNYLHNLESKIIHRDLKSHNILIDKHYQVKVADFGLSHVREREVYLGTIAPSNQPATLHGKKATHGRTASISIARNASVINDRKNSVFWRSISGASGMSGIKDGKFGPNYTDALGRSDHYGIFGTPEWMAPEVMIGEKYTEKIDVYSFGILLTELVARQMPYHDFLEIKSYFDVAEAVIDRGAVPTIPAWCDKFLKQLILACLDKDPNRRPNFTGIIRYLHDLQSLDETVLFYRFDVSRIREFLFDSRFTFQSLGAKEIAELCAAGRVYFKLDLDSTSPATSKGGVSKNSGHGNSIAQRSISGVDECTDPLSFLTYGNNSNMFSFLYPNSSLNSGLSLNSRAGPRWSLPEDDGIIYVTRISSLLSSAFLPASAATGDDDDEPPLCDNWDPIEFEIDETENFHLEMILSLVDALIGLFSVSDKRARAICGEIIAGEGALWSLLALLDARIRFETEIVERLRVVSGNTLNVAVLSPRSASITNNTRLERIRSAFSPTSPLSPCSLPEVQGLVASGVVLSQKAQQITKALVLYAALRERAGELLLAVTWQLPVQSLSNVFYGVPPRILDAFATLLLSEIEVIESECSLLNIRSSARTQLLQIVRDNLPSIPPAHLQIQQQQQQQAAKAAAAAQKLANLQQMQQMQQHLEQIHLVQLSIAEGNTPAMMSPPDSHAEMRGMALQSLGGLKPYNASKPEPEPSPEQREVGLQTINMASHPPIPGKPNRAQHQTRDDPVVPVGASKSIFSYDKGSPSRDFRDVHSYTDRSNASRGSVIERARAFVEGPSSNFYPPASPVPSEELPVGIVRSLLSTFERSPDNNSRPPLGRTVSLNNMSVDSKSKAFSNTTPDPSNSCIPKPESAPLRPTDPAKTDLMEDSETKMNSSWTSSNIRHSPSSSYDDQFIIAQHKEVSMDHMLAEEHSHENPMQLEEHDPVTLTYATQMMKLQSTTDLLHELQMQLASSTTYSEQVQVRNAILDVESSLATQQKIVDEAQAHFLEMQRQGFASLPFSPPLKSQLTHMFDTYFVDSYVYVGLPSDRPPKINNSTGVLEMDLDWHPRYCILADGLLFIFSSHSAVDTDAGGEGPEAVIPLHWDQTFAFDISRIRDDFPEANNSLFGLRIQVAIDGAVQTLPIRAMTKHVASRWSVALGKIHVIQEEQKAMELFQEERKHVPISRFSQSVPYSAEEKHDPSREQVDHVFPIQPYRESRSAITNAVDIESEIHRTCRVSSNPVTLDPATAILCPDQSRSTTLLTHTRPTIIQQPIVQLIEQTMLEQAMYDDYEEYYYDGEKFTPVRQQLSQSADPSMISNTSSPNPLMMALDLCPDPTMSEYTDIPPPPPFPPSQSDSSCDFTLSSAPNLVELPDAAPSQTHQILFSKKRESISVAKDISLRKTSVSSLCDPSQGSGGFLRMNPAVSKMVKQVQRRGRQSVVVLAFLQKNKREAKFKDDKVIEEGDLSNRSSFATTKSNDISPKASPKLQLEVVPKRKTVLIGGLSSLSALPFLQTHGHLAASGYVHLYITKKESFLPFSLGRSRWVRQFCIVKDDKLMYFDNENSDPTKPNDTIFVCSNSGKPFPLHVFSQDELSKFSTDVRTMTRRYAFSVASPGKDVILSADSEAQHLEWISAVKDTAVDCANAHKIFVSSSIVN